MALVRFATGATVAHVMATPADELAARPRSPSTGWACPPGHPFVPVRRLGCRLWQVVEAAAAGLVLDPEAAPPGGTPP